jgi:hypothetical protein
MTLSRPRSSYPRKGLGSAENLRLVEMLSGIFPNRQSARLGGVRLGLAGLLSSDWNHRQYRRSPALSGLRHLRAVQHVSG